MILERKRFIFSTPALVLATYTILITAVEVIGVFGSVVLGTLGHALLIMTLLSHYVLQEKAPYKPILLVLTLLPLLRILSLTMPVRQIPQIYWFAMVGIPLLIAAVLAIRVLGLSAAGLGLRSSPWLPQLLIAMHGMPLSLMAYLILKPKPFMVQFDWPSVVIGSLILIIFTGFIEEFIFRGMLQQLLTEIFGRAGILYSSVLFVIMYMGLLSFSYVLFIGFVGLFFGWCVHRTGSIWGVVGAHSLLNIGLIIVWPILWH